MLYNAASDKDAVVQLREIGATLHHKNGKRDDNRLENLEVRLPGRHPVGVAEEDAILVLRAKGYTVEKS